MKTYNNKMIIKKHHKEILNNKIYINKKISIFIRASFAVLYHRDINKKNIILQPIKFIKTYFTATISQFFIDFNQANN